nr:CARDB domain-containing protein [Candidatus Krumholzibacteria bacterium]
MKALSLIMRSLLISLVLTLATSAFGQTITSVVPPRVAAGIGQNITIFGSGIGHPGDLVEFDSGAEASPVASGAGWTTFEVPPTWSGDIRVRSGATGTWSNNLDLEVIYSWSGYKWPTENLQWYLNQNGAPGCTVDETRRELVESFNAWTCASDMTMSYMGTTASSGNSQTDGINTQAWTTSGWSDATISLTNKRFNVATGELYEFDTLYNAQVYLWSCSGEAGAMDVANSSAFQVGTAIGLRKVNGTADSEKTMYGFSATGEIEARTLDLDDVLGGEFMYPRAGRPDFNPGTPSGWWNPLVPRNTDDATETFAPIPGALNGNTPTHISIAMRNAGLDCAAPGAFNQLFLDGRSYYGMGWSNIWSAGSTIGLWRNFEWTVKGGRHTLRVDYDTRDEIIESNESNNTYSVQAVYSPYTLTNLSGITRTQPPERGVFSAPNCDGFRFTGNWWGAVGVLPTSESDDYDMYVYNDYVSSTVGFSTALETSFSGAGLSDFILVNGNQVGQNFVRFAGATSYDNPVGSDALIEQSNAVGETLIPGDAYGEEVGTGSVTIGVQDILRVHEVYLNDPDLTYRFTLDNLSGTADLNVSLYDAAGDYFGKWDYEVASLSTIAGGDEAFQYSPPVAGYYAVVVWKSGASDAYKANTYELRVGKALS